MCVADLADCWQGALMNRRGWGKADVSFWRRWMRNRRRSGVVRGAEAAAVAAKVGDDVLICLDVTNVV